MSSHTRPHRYRHTHGELIIQTMKDDLLDCRLAKKTQTHTLPRKRDWTIFIFFSLRSLPFPSLPHPHTLPCLSYAESPQSPSLPKEFTATYLKKIAKSKLFATFIYLLYSISLLPPFLSTENESRHVTKRKEILCMDVIYRYREWWREKKN